MRTHLVRIRNTHLAGLVGLVGAFGGSACSFDKDPEVVSVRAELTTGNEGSDGDVELCWLLDGQTECHELSSEANDFERGARQTFDVRPGNRWLVQQTPEAVWLTYSPGLSFGDSWELALLRVTAYANDDTQRTLCEATPSGKVGSRLDCL